MKIIFFDVHNYELDFLKENLPSNIEAIFTKCPLSNEFEITDEFENANAISAFALNPLDSEVLSKLKNLKYIFTRSVGFSHIDKKYCTQNNIKVFNTPHYGDYTVAEFAFGLLLSTVRKIKHASNALREGNVDLNEFIGLELYSKTLGIIGCGAIGCAAKTIALGFSMNVLCADPICGDVSLDELCEKSDIITLHAPLTEENFHMINSDKFEKMKQGVAIINTARGELIDTKALIGALENKKVAFCALDVVECEQILSNHNHDDFCLDSVNENCLKKFMLNQKLLSFPNVLITPHIAYDTKEAIKRILEFTIENISNAQKGIYKNMVF